MVKQIITDEESKLKRQARRRLIGAIALTILVVVLLPMVLDREPSAPTHDIELQIPDKDKVGEFVPNMVLPPQSSVEAASQPLSAPLIAPLLNGTAPMVAAKSEVKPRLDTTPQVEVKPVIESKPVLEVKPKPEPKPKLKQREVKPADKTIVKPHSGFVVQVGAFSHAETANALREKLLNQGFSSYTEKSGNVIRVRIGGYSTHEEAEKIRRKLEKQGMKPDVVNLN